MGGCVEPMWSNLREKNVELYREVRRVYQGENAELERVFRTKGPFWGRHYIFWHGGKPMTVVYEVFNPRLKTHSGRRNRRRGDARTDKGKCHHDRRSDVCFKRNHRSSLRR